MSMALKYAMHQRAKRMAKGGRCYAHGKEVCEMCHGGGMAEGGEVMKEDDRMLNQHGMDEVGAEGMEQDNEHQNERTVNHPVENQDDADDMVGRIMRQREEHYSEGGRVANQTSPRADFEDNQFDELAKGDDLEEHYDGANSGDEIGDEQEDEDRRDIVARIMKMRRLRDRNPMPA